jgi:hypothetical protein
VVLTFSNRCFPSKVVRGWLQTGDANHLAIVKAYLEQAGGFGPAAAQRRTAEDWHGDPLYAVWARRIASTPPDETRPAVSA